MYVIYGKWKTWNWLKMLMDKLKIENVIMDDSDIDHQILWNSEKIIISPWIPHSNIIFGKYKEKIISELNFVWEVLDDLWIKKNFEFIGVTWTNWKSTSVWILYNIFTKLKTIKDLNLTSNIRLSWNFDIPLCQTIFEILEKKLENEKHIVILECSSFMLKTLKNIEFEYSIRLNFAVDHLNRHPHIDDYFQSKKNILRLTKKTAFVNNLLKDWNIERWKNDGITCSIEIFDESYDLKSTKFMGKYNAGNINACYLLTKKYLTDNSKNSSLCWNSSLCSEWQLEKIISQIEPLPHHMILIKTIDWINIYDDAKSKSSLSIRRALECFDEKVVLIAGGYDKWWDDYSLLGDIFAEKVIFASLIGQTAKIFSEVMNGKKTENKIYPDLKSAFNWALEYAKKNQIKNLLFSPGCASYDMFKNFEERASLFVKIVNGI